MIDYSNQTDIFDPAQFAWPVHVIGLGGIGGAVLFPLLKLGVHEVHVWDTDVVEPHNIPAQLVYRPSDIGVSKAKAVQAFAERQEADCEIVIHEERVDSDTKLNGIVISGVDSMASRSDIWQAVQYNVEVPLYMDGRIGGEQLQLLTLNPSDFDSVQGYEEWLFPDSEAAELPCAARTVIHPPTVLAGLMIAQLTRFMREMVLESNIVIHLGSMQFVVS